MFVRRTVFEESCGFPEFLSSKIWRWLAYPIVGGGFHFFPRYVTTSAGRFLHVGPFRRQLRSTYLWCQFMLRTEPGMVARHYPYKIDRRVQSANVEEVHHADL